MARDGRIEQPAAADLEGASTKGFELERGIRIQTDELASHEQGNCLGGGGADRQVASGEQKRLAEPIPQPDR